MLACLQELVRSGSQIVCKVADILPTLRYDVALQEQLWILMLQREALLNDWKDMKSRVPSAKRFLTNYIAMKVLTF